LVESRDNDLQKLDWYILALTNPDGYVYSQKEVRTLYEKIKFL
jgi:murein tripeptide amidase MpaA